MHKKKIIHNKLKDIGLIYQFIHIYCRENHKKQEKQLLKSKYIEKSDLLFCEACEKLFKYAQAKRLACQYEPKPPCKKCTTPCYKGDYKSKMRDVMKFSGKYLIMRGKIGLLFKYFF